MIPKPVKKSRRKFPKQPSLKRECDMLWSKCIHARCDGRSELSGVPWPTLHAHHLLHKPNYRLRYELENGIALTPGEHKWGAHGAGAEEFRDQVIKRIGQEKWDWLKSLRGGCQKTDLNLVKLYLTEKLREWGG
jgi:hypothetical protein